MLFHIIHILDKFGPCMAYSDFLSLHRLYMSADMRETPTQTYVLPHPQRRHKWDGCHFEISFEVFQSLTATFCERDPVIDYQMYSLRLYACHWFITGSGLVN